MAGRCGGARGGVIRTYARLQPVRRVEPQKWFSPADQNHIFSSSSSHLESSQEASSSDDPDFMPKRKSRAPSVRVNVKPQRRTCKKTSSSSSRSNVKENDDRLHPSSPGALATPLRKWVTFRRKPPGPVVVMKPWSCKTRRRTHSFQSPDSIEDFTAASLRRKKPRMCSDVTNLLNSSPETLHSPLQKPPLLSSTPSMMLTAVPRKRNAFVRQLALCEALEDSVVICGVDSDSSSGGLHPSPCGVPLGKVTLPQREAILSHGVRSHTALTSSEGCGTSAGAPKVARTKSVDKRCNDGPGSGVKRLIVKTSNDRKPLSVCLLSPIVVSSPESPSDVFICEEKSAPQEYVDVFNLSAELFSGDFSIGKETTRTLQGDREIPPQQAHRSRNASVCVQMLGSSRSDGHLGENPCKSEDFCRKRFQPFVRLNSQFVAEYFCQKRGDPLNPSSDRGDLHVVADKSSVPVLGTERGQDPMQPVVILDSLAVSKYKVKDKAFRDVHSPSSRTRSEKSAVLSRRSPTIQTVANTPQITASVLKSKGPNALLPQTVGTGRKVCISGFSAKRWGTRKKKTKQQLSFQDRSREDLGFGDTHSSSLLLSTTLLTSSFLNSTAVVNLNLSTDSLTARDPQKDLQRWARLRAALSLHRRKKVEAESPSSYPVRRRNGGNMSLCSQNSSLLLLSPFQSPLCANELTDAEKVYAECQQEEPVSFFDCLTPEQLSRCQKVGEGVYGEVFRTLRGAHHVALKVIPIEGSQKVNGEHQKRFAEILPEIIISKAHCVRGSYPLELLSAWDTFAEEKGTENERPDLFGTEQLFMILEFEFGGDDLERISSKLPSVAASRSILHQVTAALAVAEEELRFEHRDLHWGNLLIEKSPSCTLSVSLCGERLEIPSAGIQVKIIDYTLSRLDKDGLTVFCDLSTDEELFQGKGDLQFDVYRGMRVENQNTWSSYRPHSNVLWLHYLCDKLLSEVKYIKKPTSAPQRRELRRLQNFRRDVKQFGSAAEVLKKSNLFK
ncbi:serine/threonine-protein kinase haspin isoform X2 [Phyllobates terribilis]|uniref:serine/threonine-protein kinase haspin isoform X2 n=1 Tax=Phyllobates terribilis TaxID=111132 RepID=UPI003CCB37FB